MSGKWGVDKKSMSAMLEECVVKKIGFSRAGKRRSQESKFSAWLKRGVLIKSISAWLDWDGFNKVQ
jgi:hypothetical protein